MKLTKKKEQHFKKNEWWREVSLIAGEAEAEEHPARNMRRIRRRTTRLFLPISPFFFFFNNSANKPEQERISRK